MFDAMKKARKKGSKKRGFTLIELIIVIAILGILAAVLVPTMLTFVDNANTQVGQTNAQTIYSVAQAAYVNQKASNGTISKDTYTFSVAVDASTKKVSITASDADSFSKEIIDNMNTSKAFKNGAEFVVNIDTATGVKNVVLTMGEKDYEYPAETETTTPSAA